MSYSTRLITASIVGSMLFATGATRADDTAAREKAAREASAAFLQKLGGALQQELKTRGPEAAVTVCRDLAPQIASEISRANGWRVTRVSTKVRNPLLGMPDGWERKVLDDFETRAAKGEGYKDMAYGEVVETGGARYYRFMKAIPTQEACVLCHGSANQISPGVKSTLAGTYPHDRAVGYRIGDLRGAVSIVQPMDIPLHVGKSD